MLWLSKRLFSLPFAFQFRHFAVPLSALFRAVFCETLSQSFPFFRYTALLLFLLHVAFKPFSIWHCRYGPFIMILLISLFRLKTTLGKLWKFRMRRQNTLQDTSPRQSTPAKQLQQGFPASRQSPRTSVCSGHVEMEAWGHLWPGQSIQMRRVIASTLLFHRGALGEALEEGNFNLNTRTPAEARHVDGTKDYAGL